MAARALLAISLSSENRKKLRRYENSLPPGRYLIGAEICKMFQLTPEAPDEMELAKLDYMWRVYEGIQWKKNKIEEKTHDQMCRNITGTWCKCRTRQQEIHEWEDWAIENFDKAIEAEAAPEESRNVSPAAVLAQLGVRSKRI